MRSAGKRIECPENIADIVLYGITADSRSVRPGWLFIAVTGMHRDGRDYIPAGRAGRRSCLRGRSQRWQSPGPVPRGCCDRYDEGQVRFFGLSGGEYHLASPNSRLRIRCGIPGDFTVSNSMEAAAALALGVQPSTVKDALTSFSDVPGRIERLPTEKDFSVFIDFVHTPDAMEKLPATFHKNMTDGKTGKRNGRIVLVFGCGGD